MFETVAVESRIQPRRGRSAAMLPVSLGIHVAAIAGFTLSSVWSVTMPNVAPAQIAAFMGVRPVPAMPEPEPQPPEPVQQPQQPAKPKDNSVFTEPVQTKAPEATPQAIPDGIPTVGAMSEDDLLREIGAGSSNVGSPAGNGNGTEVVDLIPEGTVGATMPKAIKRVNPDYPTLLIHMGLKGHAVVECIVDRDGAISSATVVRATHPLFGEAARNAVLQWKFLPGRLNGKPVATIFRLTVIFDVRR